MLVKLKALSYRQRIVAGALIAVVLALLVTHLIPPERSVAAYCKVYKAENAKLPHVGADKYNAAMFTSSSGNPRNFAVAFGKLEQVSPDDIKYNVKTLQVVFDNIDSDPSQTLSASLSGIGAESNVKDWTASHCTD